MIEISFKQISKENNPTKSAELRIQFRTLRNEITNDKRRSKKNHYQSYFESNKKKTSEIWKGNL